MNILAAFGKDDLATVYLGRFGDEVGRTVEFVESLQPPWPREQKWVLIVSSMFGCPVGCRMCDAGGRFAGVLSAAEIFAQIDHLVLRRYPNGRVPAAKFKIQFARMGEPSLNPAVLEVLERMPARFEAPGLNVSLSTVAPASGRARAFFKDLARIKDEAYGGGRFQLQFSLHTTDERRRKELIPVDGLSFAEIAAYGRAFSRPASGDKKITLNFAPVAGYPMDAAELRRTFDPGQFLIKLTPLNPTLRASRENLTSALDPLDADDCEACVARFKSEGFDVLLSIGELEENRIGSNCGQYVQSALAASARPQGSYELDRYRI